LLGPSAFNCREDEHMDDFFFFICGTVPLIIILRHKAGPDPWPGPWPWLSVLAGGVGGVLSMVIFGAKYAADGAVLPTFLVSFAACTVPRLVGVLAIRLAFRFSTP